MLDLGVEGIKADDGEGYYFPDDVRFADGRSGAERRLGATAGCTGARCSARWTRSTPAAACCSGARGWTGQQATGLLWGGDQASDFWSLRALVAATLTAAASGFSNWSHDVGGYLGERLVARCPQELLLRWVQFGCFTPLMQAHGRFAQEPWTYDAETLDALPRLRAAARAARAVRAGGGGRPRPAAGCRSSRPLLLDRSRATPRGWAIADAVRLRPVAVGRAGARGRRPRARGAAAARRLDRLRGPASAMRGGGERASRRRRSTGSRCGCARARSSSPTPPSTSPPAWATRRSASARSRPRSGASRRSGAPACGWPTAPASAGARASGRSPANARSRSRER